MDRISVSFWLRAARAFFVALAIQLSLLPLSAQMKSLGVFDHHQDVGDPKLAGNAVYNEADQTYTVTGAGADMWTNRDQFHFAWKKIKGDFIVQTTVRFVGTGAAARRKIGIIARDALTTDSRYADACVHGDRLTSLQFRPKDGDPTEQIEISAFHPTDIQFERRGNTFIFSAAVFGENYKSVSKEIELNDEAYVGLFLCSHDEGVVEQAVFSNVRVIIPAATDFVPYRDYLGSHLEVMEVATGHRRILHSEPGSIQAPNWTPDNKLIYNSAAGLMYTYDLASGKIAELNTGPRRQNNNDHVLSFDGKMLALSNYAGEPRRSTAFILPVTGSDAPVQITSPEVGHTYLHGWSPDGKKLVFTGGRKGETGDFRNLWSVDIETKVETAITPPGTLDDGPEYTPDGKYIYFNSVRTGTMQIWRMRPDGSDPEQITFDEYNDWFPHISPDGKWIVYIAFPKDMNPWSHPFCRQCYIRLMPASGGVPKTIGYLYGGQGSMNVPGWSPDSKRIAFVTNSKL
jgi:Tol biopolymer transport system component